MFFEVGILAGLGLGGGDSTCLTDFISDCSYRKCWWISKTTVELEEKDENQHKYIKFGEIEREYHFPFSIADVLFFEARSYSSPSWLGSHYVVQTDLKSRNQPLLPMGVH